MGHSSQVSDSCVTNHPNCHRVHVPASLTHQTTAVSLPCQVSQFHFPPNTLSFILCVCVYKYTALCSVNCRRDVCSYIDKNDINMKPKTIFSHLRFILSSGSQKIHCTFDTKVPLSHLRLIMCVCFVSLFTYLTAVNMNLVTQMTLL